MELDSKWNDHIPILLHYDSKRAEVSDELRQYYFTRRLENGSLESVNPADDLLNLTKMFSDGLFFEGTHRVSKMHAIYAPTYLYYYTYISHSVPSTYAMIRAARKRTWWSPYPVTVVGGLGSYYLDKMIWPSKDPSKFGAVHGDDVMQGDCLTTFCYLNVIF